MIRFGPFCPPATAQPIDTKMNKFEKMMDATRGHGEIDLLDEPENTWIAADPPPAPIDQTQSCKNDSSVTTVGLLPILATISPLWIFAVGFSLGAVTSMLGTYIWVTGSCCTCELPKIRSRDGRSRIVTDNTSQRISLLSHVTCPGTPPPPYRDVMLNSSCYPTAPAETFPRNAS